MEYRKVGRGGAGNYYSQEELKRSLNIDVEAQPHEKIVTAEDVEKSRSEYAHSGRGGAGNYTNASELAESTAQTAGVTPSLQESKPPETGHYGRGGAGNYRIGDSERMKMEQGKIEAAHQKKVYQQAVKDVEAGLKEPEKAHLGSEKLG